MPLVSAKGSGTATTPAKPLSTFPQPIERGDDAQVMGITHNICAFGGKGSGKTTGIASVLPPGEKHVWFSFDNQTEKILSKPEFSSKNFVHHNGLDILKQKGDEFIGLDEMDRMLPKRGFDSMNSIIAQLRSHSEDRPGFVIFDTANVLKHICDLSTRHSGPTERKFTASQSVGEQNYAFWGKRNRIVTHIHNMAEMIAQRGIVYIFPYAFGNDGSDEGGTIKPDWSGFIENQIEVTFHAKANRVYSKGIYKGIEYYFDVYDSKDDGFIPNGVSFDMRARELQSKMIGFFGGRA